MQQRQSPFAPILWRSMHCDAHIEAVRRHEHPVGVFEVASIDPIEPDRKSFPESYVSPRRRSLCWLVWQVTMPVE